MISVIFSISSLIYIIIFVVVYFSKTRINLIENKVYSYLLITTVIGLSIDIIGYISFQDGLFDSVKNMAIAKIYLVYYLTWAFLFAVYSYIVAFKVKRDIILKKFLLPYLILCIIMVSLPVYINVDSGSMYSYGPSVNFLFGLTIVFIVLVTICLIFRRKYIDRKKLIPLLVLIIFGSISFYIQKSNPELLLMHVVEAMVTALMYFTIENPDVQMVEELTKNRKLTEQNFEEKSNFLFKVSQDLKQPLSDITYLSQDIINNTKSEFVKESAKKINYSSKQLYTYVNSCLDVSQIDIKNLKILDSVYNSNNFFEEIKRRVETEIKNQNKNIEFRCNITNNLPLYLSGDNTKLKQIILSVLFDSIKHTKIDFVELSVNSIIKYGVCRLLIEITDCGGGMSLDKINDILNINGELTRDEVNKIDELNINLVLVHKMIKVLNGNFIIKSEDGQGTSFLIIIDQIIESKDVNESLKKIEKYSQKILNKNRLLLISDDEDLSNKIKNKLVDFDVEQSLYVKDALEKINEKKIKCILIDDKLKEMNALGVLNNLNTDIPLIIMISEKEKFLGKHYIEDGFNNFIIKEYVEDELDKVNRFL